MSSREKAPLPDTSCTRRVFLEWNRPPLPAAVEFMVDRYRADTTLNLREVIVVVPGQRAGRRLLELLVDASDRGNYLLTPPEVVTEGRLPELLYQPRKPFASPLVQRLAWRAAVIGVSPKVRATILPHPPGDDEPIRWLRVGEMIARVDAELAADGHDVESVLREACQVDGFSDHDRWEALNHMRRAYLAKLDELGLWDKYAARLVAVEKNEIHCEKEIVLLGTVDLNAVVKQMLAKIASRVTALVVASADRAEWFDRFGTLKVSAWKSAPVPLSDHNLIFAGGPVEQAEATANWLADLNGDYAVEDVAVGVPDPKVVPFLRRRLERAGVATRWVEARTIADTASYRLLEIASQFATHHRYEDFAALIRHPAVEAWLRQEDCPCDLKALDSYHVEHLPVRIEPKSVPASEDIHAAVNRVHRWLSKAAGESGLRDWADVFAAILKEIYGPAELRLDRDGDRELFDVLDKIRAALEGLRQLPASLDLRLSAANAFTVAFEPLGREPLPPVTRPDALELLGWLELPLDDAKAVLVTTFNDGFVPSAAGADAFLPDSLRQRLGVEHNDRRCARDAYATTVLVRSKARLACVVARRDAEQDPLLPSRLLFAGCEPNVLGERVRHWTKGGDSAVEIPAPGPDVNSPFKEPPRPRKSLKKNANEFRVTEFRTYLACPYRYYLKHVERLEAIDDAARELDGGAFGSLIHRVLEDWGCDPVMRDCRDAARLASDLTKRLDARIAGVYGMSRPIVRLQRAQAQRRLQVFALRQAELVAAGWRVVFVERGQEKLSVPFRVDNDEVTLIGRIDRIDYHPDTNVVRIIDYKTGDTAVPPEKVHRKNETWIDLQLPLYRHLWHSAALATGKSPAIELCYFQIPKDPAAIGVAVAEWDEGTLRSADERAQEVIRRIRNEDFWPPATPAPDYFEEYSAICLDYLHAPHLEDDEEGGDA